MTPKYIRATTAPSTKRCSINIVAKKVADEVSLSPAGILTARAESVIFVFSAPILIKHALSIFFNWHTLMRVVGMV